MLYEKYQRKIEKASSFKKWIKGHRIILITLAAIAFILLTSFMSIKGVVYSSLDIPSHFTYGDSMPYNAKAFFGEVSYEYALEGTSDWTQIQPVRTGSYQVRAKSRRIFGTPYYSDTKIFKIEPKVIDIEVEQESILYGENLPLRAALMFEDSINCDSFLYENITKDNVKVTAHKNSIKIYDKQGADVTDSYKINTVSRVVKYIKRAITVTVASATAIYDGTALSFKGYEVSQGSLAKGDSLLATFDKSRIDAGEVENTAQICVVAANGINASDLYDIEVVSGKLTVEKRPVFIKTQSARKVYDGEPLRNGDDSLSTDTPLVSGHKLEAVSSASQTNVGTCDNLKVYKITDGDKDVTNNYSFLFPKDSILEVLPRAITIKTASANKTYDGLQLNKPQYSIISQLKPLEYHTMEISFNGSQTRAGESSNTVEKIEVKNSGEDVTENYSFDYINGTLKVTARSIRVITGSDEFVYNGKEQFNAQAILQDGDTLAEGDSLQAIGPPTITSVVPKSEPIINKFTVKITNAEGEDYSDCYDVTYDYGELSMKKCEITVTTGSADLSYNGADQTFDAHAIIPDIADGQHSRVTEGTLTTLKNVEYLADGKYKQYENIFSIAIFVGDIETTSNYDIKYVYGSLTIIPKDIVVKTAAQNFIYNGQFQSDTSYKLGSQIIEGHFSRVMQSSFVTRLNRVERLQDGSFKKYPNKFEIEIFSDNGDETGNYNLVYEYGDLTMLPRPITISTNNNKWEYDGEKHSDNGSDLTKGNLVDGHFIKARESSLTFISSVIRLNEGMIGSLFNKFYVDILSADETLTDNYDISYDYGTLTILPRKITVKTNTMVSTYDGEAHFDKGFVLTEGSFVKGQTTSIVYFERMTNVLRTSEGIISNIPNILFFDIVAFYNQDNYEIVTNNYDVTYLYGTLRILPRNLTITTATKSWMYDGNAHSYSIFDITLGELVKNHKLNIKNAIKFITNVGSKENEIVLEILKGQEDLTSNYELTYNYGTLSIYPRPITVRLSNQSKQYDGTPLTSSAYIVTVNSIIEWQWVELKASGTQTEIGSSDNSITEFKIFFGQDVTYNYDITTVKGLLTVELRNLYLYGGSASKIYDGEELKSSEFSSHNLLTRHILVAETNGSQTEVGIGVNTIIRESVRITFNGKDVSSYYKIHIYEGKLHVGLKKLTLTTLSSEKEYDGTPLRDNRYEIKGELLYGNRATVLVYGERTNIGASENSAKITILDNSGFDVTNYYIITYEFGILIVTGDAGGSDLNTDGSIDLNPDGSSGSGSKDIVFKATSTTSDKVYFRVKSFGDYSMNGWSNAKPYPDGAINPLQLMNLALSTGTNTPSQISIETVSQNLSYMLPYYASNGYLTIDDTRINAEYSSPYVIDYFPYTYSENDKISLNPYYDLFERNYYEYVKRTYLQLPESTRTELLAIAAKNNLKADSSTLINDVAKFVQNAVKYDRNFNEYLGDVAIYFFTKAQTGICQHYATAATALFRALNIPARYTIGFVGDMSAGKTIDVSADQAHAWVEVYLSGMGWVQIEVTGGGSGSGGGNGGGSGDVSGDGSEEEGLSNSLTIKPVDVYKVYDGTPLYPKNEIEGYNLDTIITLERLAELGYKYKVIITGSGQEVGIWESQIEDFILYDKFGFNVTEKYNIEYKPGRIRVVNNAIIINIHSLQKYYDGEPLSYEGEDYWAEDLPKDYTLDFSLSGSLTDVGILKLSDFEDLPFHIYDNFGADVTTKFSLVFKGKPLRIDKRNIEITSISVTKAYDGKELSNSFTWLSKGFLPSNHQYNVTVSGKITDIGMVKNTIQNVSILDETGKDVTHNYKIKILFGELIIADN